MDDHHHYTPRMFHGDPLPGSYQSKGCGDASKPLDEGGSGDGRSSMQAFFVQAEEAQRVPVIIIFSYGHRRTCLDDIGSIRTTIAATDRIIDVFGVIRDSPAAQALADIYHVDVQSDARQVILQLTNQIGSNETFYDDIPNIMQTRIWYERYIEDNMLPSMMYYREGKGPTIEIVLDEDKIVQPSQPEQVVDLDELISRGTISYRNVRS